jgi:hypothetical protein
MSTFVCATGKRCRDKCRIEYWAKDSENRMMENSVSHSGFVNMSPFRVVNEKAFICSMPIRFVFDIPQKVKKILLKILLELHHVFLMSFASPEFIPSRKYVFSIGDIIK